MNILLVTSAAPSMSPLSTDEKRPQIGLGFLISVLKQLGHRVHFVDNYLKPKNVLEAGFLSRQRIDIVGLSANSICYPTTLEMLNTIQRLREEGKWNGKIAIGGPHTAVASDTIPDFVDHIVIGEGEISFPKIIDGTETARIVRGEKVADLDSLPRPAWEEFVHRPYDWNHSWVEGYPVYTFNTSRGCPYNCTFCSVNGLWGRNYRAMSAERVLDDVEYMIKYYGLRVAYFREDHFTLNKRRTIEFCEGLLRRNLDVEWMCETRADSIEDPEVIQLMGRSGCKVLYIGVESGSPRMLKVFKKGETVEQFIKAFDLARKAGIKTYASFVVGAPTETEDDLQQTYQLIDRIAPDYVGMNVFVGLPGSELYEYVKQHNLYEYETSSGILYLKGHDRRVERFYNGNPRRKIPPGTFRRRMTNNLRFRWNRTRSRLCSQYPNWFGRVLR